MPQNARPLVVLAGPIDPAGHALLETEADVVVCEELTEAAVVRAGAEAEGILFRSRPDCTESLMAACKRLTVVGRYGAGLDIVDLAAASRLGIAVVHAPGANATAVAEHALMLMLVCVKRTLAIDRHTRRGGWRGAETRGITELKGTTLGIIGVGTIGRITARLAGAFEMRVLGYDPYVPEPELRRRGVEPQATLAAMLPQCDIVTCHVPLTPETRGMIDERAIGLMKDGAIFINTCRGPVQDERALLAALRGGKLRAAGLDVWEEEPVAAGNPLLALDTVVCTPHVAGVSEEAHRAIAVQVAAEMLRVLRGEKPRVLGNPDLWPRLAHLR
jgi:D-3-phosphoglycerate dehydrogenase / 2-oxoglutarate reductase